MPLHFQAWKASCEKFGIPCDPKEMQQYAGLSTYKIAIEVLKKYNHYEPALAEAMARHKIETFDRLHHRVEPVEEIVRLVYDHHGKLPMAVGTGGTRATALETLRILDLRDYFEAVVAAEDVAGHKPEPDTFLKCAELLKVRPELCHVFEDGDRGIEAARRAGMTVTDVRQALPGKNLGIT
jgi:HAD superfamily hydrolase (TIGR01509 family)